MAQSNICLWKSNKEVVRTQEPLLHDPRGEEFYAVKEAEQGATDKAGRDKYAWLVTKYDDQLKVSWVAYTHNTSLPPPRKKKTYQTKIINQAVKNRKNSYSAHIFN